MSKMQPSVTDYFKQKKRAREDLVKQKLITEASAKSSKETKQLPILKVTELDKSSPATTVSPAKKITPIEAKQFYSPVKSQNIFTSPIKLKDIKSPLKLPERATKRLFDTSETSDAAPPKKIPAYQRFQHLTEKTLEPKPTVTPPSPSKVGQSTEPSSVLPLPLKLRVLEELFKAVESVTSILHNRKEIITFTKVKSSVLKLVRRVSLKEKHLGQMLAVYPGCYKLTQEKLKASDCDKLVYELVLNLNPNDELKMSATLMTERQRIFHLNLLNMCLSRHKEFLEALVPPVIVPDDKVVTRWHPKFNLDTIPDINGVDLPTPPSHAQPSTARDVINKAQHILDSANPRMKKALQDLLKKTAPENSNKTSPSVVQANDDNVKKSIGALKGISQSLIEKIRAREKQKSIRAITITPEESKRKVILGRLPTFVKMLRNLMVAEKKVAVSLDIAIERLSHSNHGSIPPGEIEEHIQMMATVLPDWIKILTLSQGHYVKIDKTVDINELLERLKEIAKN